MAAAKREREVAQVPRRGTCKCVRAGSAVRRVVRGRCATVRASRGWGVCFGARWWSAVAGPGVVVKASRDGSAAGGGVVRQAAVGPSTGDSVEQAGEITSKNVEAVSKRDVERDVQRDVLRGSARPFRLRPAGESPALASPETGRKIRGHLSRTHHIRAEPERPLTGSRRGYRADDGGCLGTALQGRPTRVASAIPSVRGPTL